MHTYIIGGTGTGVLDSQSQLEFELQQNYPNPFLSGAKSRYSGNPQTVIRYRITSPSDVQLKIFNMLGQQVCTLVSKKQSPGKYQVIWDGKDNAGFQVASGIYFYKLTAGKTTINRKMLLMR
ncbi:MAG: FlgD immunoglobulin-like domain containing protein [bacterium]